MRQIEDIIMSTVELIKTYRPIVTKHIERNSIDYVAMTMFFSLLIASLLFGVSFGAAWNLGNMILMSCIIIERERTYKAKKEALFYEDVALSLLRERHGVQRITDVRYVTEYDKRDNIFYIKERVIPKK